MADQDTQQRLFILEKIFEKIFEGTRRRRLTMQQYMLHCLQQKHRLIIKVLPFILTCSQRTVADKLEGLCLLLRQTAYICHYSDLTPTSGRPVPELSMITNCVIDHLYNSHGHCITQWNHQILKPPRFFRRMLMPSLNKVPRWIIASGLLTEL